ncbi:GSCOCG00002051001-RA-CDS [Cotesia congregata]|nr:GSCOCG00002051001-RA-CDS [Cotesia congregata]
MSLANFSLPFPVATPSPYLYTPSISQSVNNLPFNGVLPSPNFNEQSNYQNQPYLPPAYQRQHYPQRQYQVQTTQNYLSQDNNFDDYEQDYPVTQSSIRESENKNNPQHEIRPPLLEINQEDRIANRNAPSNQPQDLNNPQPDGYTKVNSYGSSGAKTSVHAVLDYDDDGDETNSNDEYYDENIPRDPRVTPIQGPIYVKNGSVPVVPLYSYQQYNNGSFLQIPILWTALSVALGVELHGDVVKGTPCIKKYHQLFCPTAGKTYPKERIELFIDENKALMKRMYGDFETDKDHGPGTSSSAKRRKRRSFDPDLPDGGPSLGRKNIEDSKYVRGGDSYFEHIRNPRQLPKNNHSDSGRLDVCESKTEVVTPYWASNSAGKIRAVVNTQHFEQAIHQEVCSKTQTNRCTGGCGCEQKYKWHRLLAYDPDDDCKGIFMDWFLFPSCCVCRCDPHAKFPGTGTATGTGTTTSSSSSTKAMTNRSG